MSDKAILCPDGRPLRQIRLCHPSGMSLALIDWGAAWTSCRIPLAAGVREVLLGHACLADYFTQPAFFGATIGRFANRIAQATIMRDGRVFALTPNQGVHQLHGGAGFHARRWQIVDQGAAHVLLRLESAEGDQGFPGNLVAQVGYRLGEDCSVHMAYTATVDRPCPVSLSNHAYFNLDGHPSDIRQHSLQIKAQHYLPTDDEMIPLGHLAPLAGTSFDFRQAKLIGQDFLADAQQQRARGYDHAFLLDSACRGMGAVAATLVSADRLLAMDVWTTLPALQCYSGNHLAGVSARGGGGYQACQGVALETQFLPDSPNHPEWPEANCWLLPGETYQQSTMLVFRPLKGGG